MPLMNGKVAPLSAPQCFQEQNSYEMQNNFQELSIRPRDATSVCPRTDCCREWEHTGL